MKAGEGEAADEVAFLFLRQLPVQNKITSKEVHITSPLAIC